MTPPLIAGCVWVLAAAITAMLPMRRQYLPGISLLILAPVLIGWIGWQHGVWIGVAAMAAFLSMFRNPLIYFARKAMGLPVHLPSELEGDPKP
ncbi:MAG: DUF2484 family protein [Pseudomonadota bacterium]